ncbi:MAG: hypothetical protein ACJAUG_002182 [Halioglobus sp.]
MGAPELENTEQYVAGIRAAFERAELDGWQENQLSLAVYTDRPKNYGVRATLEELIR